MNRGWALAAVLGLLAATAVWTGPHEPKHRSGPASTSSSSSSSTASAPLAVVLPFAEALGPEGNDTRFLLLAPLGRAAAERSINESGLRAGSLPLEWANDRLAFYTMPNVFEGCRPEENGTRSCTHVDWAVSPLPRARAVAEGDPGPRLGVDGYNGTRITVHVFDETGLLAATNADANETARLAGKAHPQQLPGGVWYVGANSTAPNGTQPIPAQARPLFEQLKPMMRGLPVGGVASVRSDAYAAIYGPLYVTVRIDGLMHAP